ncbi:hypothetical protein YC2023_015396 [Brassica napus]
MKQKQEQHGHWNKNFISLSLSLITFSLPYNLTHTFYIPYLKTKALMKVEH